ncbi:globin domain-containing protein [Tahibacter caeni]|uniref:globin domain-containing protein n=1 Tax=Tahibacter caeni TaxID=1453545 RepID=UPI0021472CE9|nr:globin domain-containing protein [Tahibacter caeni]
MHTTTAPVAWLDPASITLIRANFAAIAGDADGFAADFYTRLFALAPQVRPMFGADLAEQRTKLVRMLSMLVAGLDRPDQLAGPLANLGQRHAGYEVQSHHYAIVGAALLDTLAARLGADFDDAAHTAWATLYGGVAANMQRAFAAAA